MLKNIILDWPNRTIFYYIKKVSTYPPKIFEVEKCVKPFELSTHNHYTSIILQVWCSTSLDFLSSGVTASLIALVPARWNHHVANFPFWIFPQLNGSSKIFIRPNCCHLKTWQEIIALNTLFIALCLLSKIFKA